MSPGPTDRDRLELLSVELLEGHRRLADRFRRLSRATWVPLGWHYLLDLTWIAAQVGAPGGRSILDAGAGLGALQWCLAEEGAEVLSVDTCDRRGLAPHLRWRGRVRGFGAADLGPGARRGRLPRELTRGALGFLVGRAGRSRGRLRQAFGAARSCGAACRGAIVARAGMVCPGTVGPIYQPVGVCKHKP